MGVLSGWLLPTWGSLSCASHWLFPTAVVKNPPNNLWIIAAVLAPIAVVTIIIIIITAVLCRKNKNDFKPDTMINLPQRAKVYTGMERARMSSQRLYLPFSALLSGFRGYHTTSF